MSTTLCHVPFGLTTIKKQLKRVLIGHIYSNMSTVCNSGKQNTFMKAKSIIQMDVTLPLLHSNYACKNHHKVKRENASVAENNCTVTK